MPSKREQIGVGLYHRVWTEIYQSLVALVKKLHDTKSLAPNSTALLFFSTPNCEAGRARFFSCELEQTLCHPIRWTAP